MDPNNSNINNDSLPPLPATPQAPPPPTQATPPQQPLPTQNPVDPSFYPQITAVKIENPSRLWAFPILGGLVKFIILIPVFIFLYIIGIFAYLLTFINAFIVLFTGKYWQFAFDINKKLLTYNLKYFFFLMGLTNKYPGFNFEINDNFSVNIDYPQSSSRVFAIPILGGVIRYLLLTPFAIFYIIILYAALVGSVLASFSILILGKYPDSIFELVRDATRLTFSYGMYSLGISDKYPSFKISWNHKLIKIILIFFSVIIVIGMFINTLFAPKPAATYKQPPAFNQNIH